MNSRAEYRRIHIDVETDPARKSRGQRWTVCLVSNGDVSFLETARTLWDARVKAISWAKREGVHDKDILIEGIPATQYIARGPGHGPGFSRGIR